jgi:hypothetical protein
MDKQSSNERSFPLSMSESLLLHLLSPFAIVRRKDHYYSSGCEQIFEDIDMLQLLVPPIGHTRNNWKQWLSSDMEILAKGFIDRGDSHLSHLAIVLPYCNDRSGLLVRSIATGALTLSQCQLFLDCHTSITKDMLRQILGLYSRPVSKSSSSSTLQTSEDFVTMYRKLLEKFIHAASSSSSSSVSSLSLDSDGESKGARSQLLNGDQTSLLLTAIKNSSLRLHVPGIVRLLIEYGVDVNYKATGADRGRSPLWYACGIKNSRYAHDLLDGGATLSSPPVELLQAILKGHVDIVAHMLVILSKRSSTIPSLTSSPTLNGINDIANGANNDGCNGNNGIAAVIFPAPYDTSIHEDNSLIDRANTKNNNDKNKKKEKKKPNKQAGDGDNDDNDNNEKKASSSSSVANERILPTDIIMASILGGRPEMGVFWLSGARIIPSRYTTTNNRSTNITSNNNTTASSTSSSSSSPFKDYNNHNNSWISHLGEITFNVNEYFPTETIVKRSIWRILHEWQPFEKNDGRRVATSAYDARTARHHAKYASIRPIPNVRKHHLPDPYPGWTFPSIVKPDESEESKGKAGTKVKSVKSKESKESEGKDGKGFKEMKKWNWISTTIAAMVLRLH